MDKPQFRRHDSHKRAKLSASWRRPRGRHNKVRLHKRGYKRGPSKGFGRDKAAFGTIKGGKAEGLLPILVSTSSQLDALDAKRHAIVIAATVGGKKREAIVAASKAKGLTLLADAERQVAAIKGRLAARKKAQETRAVAKQKRKALDEKVKEGKKGEKEEAAPDEEERKAQEKREQDKVLTQRQT